MEEIAGVESDAQEIGGDEAKLGSAHTDDADDGAVYRGDDPALPEFRPMRIVATTVSTQER